MGCTSGCDRCVGRPERRRGGEGAPVALVGRVAQRAVSGRWETPRAVSRAAFAATGYWLEVGAFTRKPSSGSLFGHAVGTFVVPSRAGQHESGTVVCQRHPSSSRERQPGDALGDYTSQ